MRSFAQLEGYLKIKRFIDGLQEIHAEIHIIRDKKSVSYIKQWLASISSEEDFYTLIRLMDEGLMYHYSGFLARYAYRRFPSIRTLTWFCEELMNERKPLDAEELLKAALQTAEQEQAANEHLAKLHFTLSRCLLEMHRYEEALLYMKKSEEYSTAPMLDKWGYFYMFKGDWELAEEMFQHGMKNGERADVSAYLLAQLYAGKGEHEAALHILEHAILQYPQVPILYLERIRRLRDLKKHSELLQAMDELDSMLPFHTYKKYFAHLRAEIFYNAGDTVSFTQLLEQELCLNKSPYQHTRRHIDGKRVMLPLTPVLQKDNYCVPASMEMILKGFGHALTQDEISVHIFDKNGSRLSKTIAYAESLGYSCRYFRGTIESYKKLIDSGIPILLSVDFEQAAHVQIIIGYDDRLQSLYIQDPNFLEPMIITYEDFYKQHLNTNYLSIAAVPFNRVHALASLSSEDDVYFRDLFSLLDQTEDNHADLQPLTLFLKKNMEIPYTWLHVIKSFGPDGEKELIFECAKRLLEAYPESDYVKMHAAQCFIRIDKRERANDMLLCVKNKINSPMYYFIQGRLALDDERYEDSIASFRASLQLDADQPFAWSYMALGYMHKGQSETALEKSWIARKRYENRFVLVNHGLILMDLKRCKEAYDIFDSLVREDKYDAYVWYERARCAHRMGKLRLAIRGFSISKSLESHMPYPYLRLSEIYETELKDDKRAEQILAEGIQNSEGEPILYGRLGDFYTERLRYDQAEHMYRNALGQDPGNAFVHLGLIEVYIGQGNYEKGKQYALQMKAQFATDSYFLVNTGKILWDTGIEQHAEALELETALAMIEEGIGYMYKHVEEALELYVSRIEDTPYLTRGIALLEELTNQHPENIHYRCYLGVLYENVQQYAKAIDLYHEALEIEKNTFPYYRLGETYKAVNHLEQARKFYQKCLELDSDFPAVHLRLAEISHVEKDVKQEQYHMLRAAKQEPLTINIEYLASLSTEPSLHQEFVSMLTEMRGRTPENWRLDSLAYAYGAAGDVQKEQQLVMDALQIDPEHPEVLYHYANMLLKQRDKQALKIATELLQENVHNESIYPLYINTLKQQKTLLYVSDSLHKLKIAKEEKSYAFMYAASAMESLLAEQNEQEKETGSRLKRTFKRLTGFTKQLFSIGTVIDLYETAMKLDPENSTAAQRFAQFYEHANLIDDAIKTLRKSLNTEWNHETAYQLASLLLNHSDNHTQWLKEALGLSERVLQEQPNSLHIQHLQAYTLADLNREEEAEERFLYLVRTAPFISKNFIDLARLYKKQEKYEKAISLLEEGRQHHPQEGPLYVALGIAYHMSGQTDKALELMEQVLTFDEEYLTARYNRACYLAVLNRTEEAELELAKVLEEDESGYFVELAEDDPDLMNIRDYAK
ncbi:tetratricopeptide repeat protein [Ectobacillus panaciterrae]|uniref:tetratricopeptide repeat protein n=1 Tax=Ectobacillus panaciterrae TaxID=363872 RepID=UPI0004129340|nr:tetratricopeptide repeat protein [Ectobacillus panaciterrae]